MINHNFLKQTIPQSFYSNVSEDFYIEPIYGIRVWELFDHQLMGLRGYSWHPGVNVAECKKIETQRCSAIDQTCSCGFYAYWRRNGLLSESIPKGVHNSAARPYIFGVVKSYGKIVIGEAGYRAEKSQIVALANISMTWWVRKDYVKYAHVPEAFETAVPYFDRVGQMLEHWPCEKLV